MTSFFEQVYRYQDGRKLTKEVVNLNVDLFSTIAFEEVNPVRTCG